MCQHDHTPARVGEQASFALLDCVITIESPNTIAPFTWRNHLVGSGDCNKVCSKEDSKCLLVVPCNRILFPDKKNGTRRVIIKDDI